MAKLAYKTFRKIETLEMIDRKFTRTDGTLSPAIAIRKEELVNSILDDLNSSYGRDAWDILDTCLDVLESHERSNISVHGLFVWSPMDFLDDVGTEYKGRQHVEGFRHALDWVNDTTEQNKIIISAFVDLDSQDYTYDYRYIVGAEY